MQKEKHYDEESKWLNEIKTDLLGDGDTAGSSASHLEEKGRKLTFCVTLLGSIIMLKEKGREPWWEK